MTILAGYTVRPYRDEHDYTLMRALLREKPEDKEE